MTAAMAAAGGIAVVPTALLVITSGSASQDRSGFDATSSTFGSLSPTGVRTETCVRARHAGAGGGDSMSVRLDNTSIPQGFFKSLRIVGTNWDELFVTADADSFNDNDGGRTTWAWNLVHSVMVNTEDYNATFSFD